MGFYRGGHVGASHDLWVVLLQALGVLSVADL